MATQKEKEDLIESFKGPFYYRISISGYGAESSYMNISKEAHDYWSAVKDEHGDHDCIQYVLNAEDYASDDLASCEEFEDIDPGDIPTEVMFMHDEDGAGYPWYEPLNEHDRNWAATMDSSYLTVEKVDSKDWNAQWIEDVIEHEDVGDFIGRVEEESDGEHEAYAVNFMTESNPFPEKGQHICLMQSAEKGTFIETILETPLPFDQNLLKLQIGEAPNGEDLVFGLEYDGVELDQDGGDTNGKGYYIYFYEQEF